MATDKLKGFFEQAAQNPDILGEVGDLVKGFDQNADGTKDDLFAGILDIAEKFGIDLTPDDIDVTPKAGTDSASADDGFGFDDLGDLAGSLLGGGKSGDSPLESLLVLFRQFTAK